MKFLLLTLLLLGITLSFTYGKPRGRVSDVLPQVEEEGADDDDDDVDGAEDTVVSSTNPCNIKKCKRGEECILEKGLKAKCVCVKNCHTSDTTVLVCSTKNDTFNSECHLDREACWCKNDMKQCGDPSFKKLRLDYYGECKQLTPCTDDEMKQFPLRIRNWMYVIMKELARRHEIDNDYLNLLETAQTDDHHTDAVIWKFCDLDTRPRDRFVTRRELQFVTATVKPMEHCLVPFLDKCDKNQDRKISLTEWGKCLDLDEKEMHDKCTSLQNKRKNNKNI